MKFKTNQWSLLELSGLLEEEDSCVYFERTKKHLALHPFHLTNLQTAVNEILSSTLNTYDTELKGFLLAYKNPKLLTELGETLYDTCFVHIEVEADFYIFRPEVGCSVKGIVNKKGLDHMIILIHKTFTVSIPKLNLEQYISDLDIGQEVKCVLTKIDKSTKIPFICGTLNSDYLEGCRLLHRTENIDHTNAAVNNNTLDGISEINDKRTIALLEDNSVSNGDRKKDRKKHKKTHESNLENVVKIEKDIESDKNSKNSISTSNKCEDKQEQKNIKRKYSVSNSEHSTDDTEINDVQRKRKKKKSYITISEDDAISDKEKKKDQEKFKKPHESNFETVVKSEKDMESDNNSKNSISTSSKSEYKQEQKNMKRKYNVSNSDYSTDNTEIDDVPRKRKKNKSDIAKSEDNAISDREKKKDGEKYKNPHESNLKIVIKREKDLESDNNSTDRFYINVKSEDKQKRKNIKNNYSTSNNYASGTEVDSTPKKHKKNKTFKVSSDFDLNTCPVKIKDEKPDPIIDKIFSENGTSSSKKIKTQNFSGKNKNVTNTIKVEDTST